MADYQITIQATCNGLDEIERRLQRILSNNGKTFDIGNPAKDINKQVQQIQKGMTSSGKKIGADFSKGFNSGLKTVKSPSLKDTVNSAKKQAKSVQKATKDALKIDSSLDEKTAKQIANQYVNQQVRAEQRAQAEIQKIRDASNKQQQRDFEKLQSQSNKILADQQQKSYAVKDAEIESKVQRYAGLNKDLVNSYRSAYKNLNDVADSYSSDKSINNMERLVKANDDYARSVKTLGNEFKIASINGDKLADSKKIADFYRTVDKFKKDNNRLKGTPYDSQLDSILSGSSSSDLTNSQLKKFQDQFADIKKNVQIEGLGGKSFLSTLGTDIKRLGSAFSVLGIADNLVSDLPRQIYNAVSQVDSAMTDLRMATGVSNDEATQLMDTYSSMGDRLKATSTDVAASSTEWLKQGKSISEANALTEDSIILSKIGGLSSEDATKTITAAMKAYNMSADDVMGFVDQISAIDLASATDVGGLATAFNEVAANAKQAGVSTEELLSYAAVIGETTQEGMASVGTSLNAVFARMGNIKLSRLKDYETGEDLSNVETVLRGVGINLRDTQDEFRDFDEVLDETAGRWNSFSGVQQRAVAQAFAG